MIMKKINDIGDINNRIEEGRLLLAALAIITTECRTNKTPEMVISEINNLSEKMFVEEPKILK
jgi:hypothetical protein